MKKSLKAVLMISLVLVLAGSACCITSLVSVGFKIGELATDAPAVKNIEDVEINGSTNIRIYTQISDLSISPSADDKLHVTYYTSKNFNYIIENNEDGVLIKENQITRPWYEYLAVSFGSGDVSLKVELPDSYKGDIFVSCNDSSATINGINISGDLNISADDDVMVNSVKAANLDISTENGRITCGKVETSENLRINSTYMDVFLGNITCGNTMSCSTNDASINHTGLLKASIVDLYASDGGISVGVIDAKTTVIKTGEGSVSGTSVGSASDYAIVAEADNFVHELDKGSVGVEKSLNLSAGQSSIDWNFEE